MYVDRAQAFPANGFILVASRVAVSSKPGQLNLSIAYVSADADGSFEI